MTMLSEPVFGKSASEEEGMYQEVFETAMTGESGLPFDLPQWIATAPFEEYLDMTIEEASGGRAVLSMPFKVKHAQGKGLMHGGAITALADTAVAMAIKSILPEGSHFATTDLSLQFHAPIVSGLVRATAVVEAPEERIIRGVAEIHRDDGIKAATFRSVFKVKR